MLRIHGDSGKSRILLDIYGNNQDSLVIQYVNNNPVCVLPQNCYIISPEDGDGNDLFYFIKEEIDTMREKNVDYLPPYIIIYSNLKEEDDNFQMIVEKLILCEEHRYCRQSIFMYQ